MRQAKTEAKVRQNCRWDIPASWQGYADGDATKALSYRLLTLVTGIGANTAIFRLQRC
jgi:hypothetical protein